MKRKSFLCSLLFSLSVFSLHAETQFEVLVLGSGGGPIEDNLSGYAVSAKGTSEFIVMDAGSLLGGLIRAEQSNAYDIAELSPDSIYMPAADFLKNRIKAYLISHAHLDHISGLVINSTDDTKKPIYGIDPTIDALRDHIFNWIIWPNYGSEGKKPRLNKYQYQRLKPGKSTAIDGTKLTVEAYVLSHAEDNVSTAFLVETNGAYLLYLGDTAADVQSRNKRLAKVWERVAPIIKEGKLKAIFIECSYPDEQKDSELNGHLDPRFLMQELDHLACLVAPGKCKEPLIDLKVIVTHIKENLLKGATGKQYIEHELSKQNDLGIQFIFPYQGQKLEL